MGNATLNVRNNLDNSLVNYLGFILQDNLLIRLDIFNEFEKQLFKRENRGPFSLPMDLSNLLGIKKDKLINILKNKSFLIQEFSDNDLVISKKIKITKTQDTVQKKLKKALKNPLKSKKISIKKII